MRNLMKRDQAADHVTHWAQIKRHDAASEETQPLRRVSHVLRDNVLSKVTEAAAPLTILRFVTDAGSLH